MSRKLLFLFFIISFSVQSQDIVYGNLLSQTIGNNIKQYRQKSQRAYADQDFERADELFNSFINDVVNGSVLDNFKVRKLSGKTLEFYDFEKPVFLMTYASWCTPGVGEIPALNEIANEHYKDVDFVVLYWDNKKKVRKIANEYSKKIKVVYVDELKYTNNTIIETLKHTLGFPTSFFVDANKKILDVRRGALHHYNEKYAVSFELNYTSFLNGISLLKTIAKEGENLVTKKP